MNNITLFILNDAPYGNERAYNALRLAAALAGLEGQQVRLFLMADAVTCAKAGQKVPEGYYNVQLMLGKVIRKGEVGLCGTCMDARGLTQAEVVEGANRSTLAQLASWTAEAAKVIVF
ncbi:MAG TPA: DsrE family protein [Rhodoferax sp.]|nr:DsrE family protein [Rhodoferax sp.]